MSFVRDHDNIAAIAQCRHPLPLLRKKLLNRREDNAATGYCEQLSQSFSVLSLDRHLSEDIMAPLELAEELVVEVIAVSENHQRRVLHRWMTHHAGSVKEHRETLATPLSVPDHAGSAVARLATLHSPRQIAGRFLTQQSALNHRASPYRFLDCRVDCVELMVSSDDLMDRTIVGVLLEDNEVLKQVEEPLPLKHSSNHYLKFQGSSRRIAFTIDRSPNLEPLLVGSQRSDPSLQAVAQYHCSVVLQQRWNLRLVRLHLRVGAPDGCVFIGCVF